MRHAAFIRGAAPGRDLMGPRLNLNTTLDGSLALLDPELAAQLLKEGNPANRAALAQKTKAFLGNEASHLADLLDGEEKGDPIKNAIMR
jgi:hypothetical protein